MSLRESRAEDERKGRAERVEVVARAAADHDEEAWTSSHQIHQFNHCLHFELEPIDCEVEMARVVENEEED